MAECARELGLLTAEHREVLIPPESDSSLPGLSCEPIVLPSVCTVSLQNDACTSGGDSDWSIAPVPLAYDRHLCLSLGWRMPRFGAFRPTGVVEWS